MRQHALFDFYKQKENAIDEYEAEEGGREGGWGWWRACGVTVEDDPKSGSVVDLDRRGFFSKSGHDSGVLHDL